MALFKKLRFALRYLSAIGKKHFVSLLIGLSIGALFFFVIRNLSYLVTKPFASDKIGLIGQYRAEDLPQVVTDNLSFGLTQITKTGEVLPSLATSWESTDSGKTYRFNLQGHLPSWHDGTKFSLADYSPAIKDVTIDKGNQGITFHLKEPYSFFPSLLAKPIFKSRLVGLGRYRLGKITYRGNIVKDLTLLPLDTSLPVKYYRFYPNEKELITGFNLGEIDTLSQLFDSQNVASGPKIVVSSEPVYSYVLALYMDTKKSPFTEKNFRQAIAYAVDKPADFRALNPYSSESWVYNPEVKPYQTDLVRAKELIGKDAGDYLKNTFVISTFPQHEAIANKLRTNLTEIGIKTEVKIVSFLPDDFDFLIAARRFPIDPDQYYFWHSTQAGNISGFKNPRLDKFLEDGRRLTTQAEIKSSYQNFQRFLVEESPAIFISYVTTYTVKRLK